MLFTDQVNELGTWQILTSSSLHSSRHTLPALSWKQSPQAMTKQCLDMEIHFSGLCEELSCSNHSNIPKYWGKESHSSMACFVKKMWHLHTCFIMSPQFLDENGANSWSLFACERKSVRKQDFTKPKPFHSKHHRLKSIAKYEAGSWRDPGDRQLWKLWYPLPQDRCAQRAGTLEAGAHCSTEFQRKKSNFAINEKLFSKLQCDQKLLFS